MMILYVVLLVMTIMGSVASLFLKKASGGTSIVELIKNINLYIGGFLYLGAAVLNIIMLRYFDYSVVLPLTSLTYVWTLFISSYILSEKITGRKVMGVLLIIGGAFLITL